MNLFYDALVFFEERQGIDMSKKRRYCIFAAQYFPHLGGVERYTYNLSKKLIEKGNEVVIVTSNVYHLSSYEKVDEIPVDNKPAKHKVRVIMGSVKNNSRT